jgi:ribosomal protein S18 acetylase RimI-like enzyme
VRDLETNIVSLAGIGEIEPLAELARQEGFAFVDRLQDEWKAHTNRFDKPGEALLGAYNNDILVGIAGLTLQAPSLGRIRRVYVHPGFRRLGIASRLLEELLAIALQNYSAVVLFTDNPAAAAFYERLGFVPEAVDGHHHSTHRLVFQSICPKQTA